MDKNLNQQRKSPMLSVLLAQNRENTLKRQNSISIQPRNLDYSIKKYSSTPSPTCTSLREKHLSFFPRSVDSQLLKNRNHSADQGESMHFLQVHSPTRTGLPHQYSGESTESATSCLSGVSTASPEVFLTDSGPEVNINLCFVWNYWIALWQWVFVSSPYIYRQTW